MAVTVVRVLLFVRISTNDFCLPRGRFVALCVVLLCAWAMLLALRDPASVPAVPAGLSLDAGMRAEATADIGRRTVRALAQHGIDARLTREGGVDTATRGAGAPRRGFVAARVQTEPPTDLDLGLMMAGAQSSPMQAPRTYYPSESPSGRRLAAAIQTQLDPILEQGQTDPEPAEDLPFGVDPPVVAALVKVGAAADPAVPNLLMTASYREQVAQAIARGIREHLGE